MDLRDASASKKKVKFIVWVKLWNKLFFSFAMSSLRQWIGKKKWSKIFVCLLLLWKLTRQDSHSTLSLSQERQDWTCGALPAFVLEEPQSPFSLLNRFNWSNSWWWWQHNIKIIVIFTSEIFFFVRVKLHCELQSERVGDETAWGICSGICNAWLHGSLPIMMTLTKSFFDQAASNCKPPPTSTPTPPPKKVLKFSFHCTVFSLSNIYLFIHCSAQFSNIFWFSSDAALMGTAMSALPALTAVVFRGW